MHIVKNASAGTLESSDVYVEIEPANGTLTIQLESVVQAQFGDAILAVTNQVLQENGVESANVRITDRGALECVLRARLETALHRGKEEA